MTIISIRTMDRGPAAFAGQMVPTASVISAPYAPQGPRIFGTSQTKNTIDLIGPKTFVMDQFGLSFMPGVRLRITAQDDLTQFVEGVVVSYATNTKTLVLTPDFYGGLLGNEYSAWNVNVTGERGE